MLTQTQERALRRLLLAGGRLSLPGHANPIHLKVTRDPGAELDIAYAEISQGGDFVVQYTSWRARDLYPEIAEVLDRLTRRPSVRLSTTPEILEEVRHG